MTLTRTLTLTAAAVAMLYTAPSAREQQPAPVAGTPAARQGGRGGGGGFRQPDPIDFNEHDGWTSLFDGRTLNGWSGDDHWKVEDGAIVVESTCEKPTGTTDVMGRMRWDAPSLTVRTEFFKPEKGQYLHPQWDADDPALRVNRVITHREAARLQTFPADFVWCGSKIDIAKQIGNAVPARLASAIAAHLRPFIESA